MIGSFLRLLFFLHRQIHQDISVSLLRLNKADLFGTGLAVIIFLDAISGAGDGHVIVVVQNFIGLSVDGIIGPQMSIMSLSANNIPGVLVNSISSILLVVFFEVKRNLLAVIFRVLLKFRVKKEFFALFNLFSNCLIGD